MKFMYPEIERFFDLDDGTLNTIVIENQGLFCRLLTDLRSQIDGGRGRSVLSHNDEPLDISKYVEILDSFIPFDINRKSLLSKIVTCLEKEAVSSEHYEYSMILLRDVENYLNSLTFEFPCDIVFPRISVSSLIKSAAPELRDSGGGLSEKLIDYMELVCAFDRKKMFVMVNLRSYLSDREAELFAQTVIPHGYRVLMIENAEKPRLLKENRLIIDCDLCEIS